MTPGPVNISLTHKESGVNDTFTVNVKATPVYCKYIQETDYAIRYYIYDLIIKPLVSKQPEKVPTRQTSMIEIGNFEFYPEAGQIYSLSLVVKSSCGAAQTLSFPCGTTIGANDAGSIQVNLPANGHCDNGQQPPYYLPKTGVDKTFTALGTVVLKP
jgi:hypothetical protein